ncbi:MAG: hypothetical protein ACTS3R_20755 [Inquilinaceae bacterium]
MNAAGIPDTKTALGRSGFLAPTALAAIHETEIDHSLRLLGSANLSLSAFRLTLWGLDNATASALMRDAFDRQGFIHPLGNATYVLLMVRFDDDQVLTRQVLQRLRRILDDSAVDRRISIEVSSLHYEASAISDIGDLMAELCTQDCLVLDRAA